MRQCEQNQIINDKNNQSSHDFEDNVSYNSDEVKTIDFDERATHVRFASDVNAQQNHSGEYDLKGAHHVKNKATANTDNYLADIQTKLQGIGEDYRTRSVIQSHRREPCLANIPNSSDGTRKTTSLNGMMSPQAANLIH